MQWAIAIAVALFLFFTCQDNERSAREARAAREARMEKDVARRVKQEVARKTEELEQKYSIRQAELRTVRAVGFILLAGGALGGLIWLQRNHAYTPPQPGERNVQMPIWRDHYSLPSTRVIDLPPHPPITSPASQDTRNQPNSTPPRRRARRRRHRNQTHRNQDHDATPSHR